VDWLSAGGASPEWWVDKLRARREAREVIDDVRAWPQFGPWIAFKAADMLERVLRHPLRFRSDLGIMYAEPLSGLQIATRDEGNLVTAEAMWNRLLAHFWDLPAPPRGDRRCGPQEVDTICCKFKS
jgi:hypothetical protein